MSDEVILQVKVRRKDVYDAVRNILLNEFKILPHDLMETVNKKLDNRIKEAVSEAVYRRYGFDSRVEGAIKKVIDEAKASLAMAVEKIVREEVEAGIKLEAREALRKIFERK